MVWPVPTVTPLHRRPDCGALAAKPRFVSDTSLRVVVGDRHEHKLLRVDRNLDRAAPSVTRVEGDVLYRCDFDRNMNRATIRNRQLDYGPHLRGINRNSDEVPPKLRRSTRFRTMWWICTSPPGRPRVQRQGQQTAGDLWRQASGMGVERSMRAQDPHPVPPPGTPPMPPPDP